MRWLPKAFVAVAAVGLVVTFLATRPRSRKSADAERAAATAPGSAAILPASAAGGTAKPVVHVWKAPGCECCSGWIDHMRAAGYPVEVEEAADIDALKRARGIPVSLGSCHTALVDGYVVEGHVPAEDVDRLLAEHPDVAGLAVPGMPVGSPGMEMGDRHDRYQVMAFTRNGDASVFSER